MSNSSRYVRVYQDNHKVRSVGGLSGQILIQNFWNELNPLSAIVWDYKGTFPSKYRYSQGPYLIYAESQITTVTTYSGLIYLVEVQKRSSRRRIKDIYVAEYSNGLLISMTHMHAATPVNISEKDDEYQAKNKDVIWFDKNQFIKVKVQKGKSTIYTVSVFTGVTNVSIPVTVDKHIIMTDAKHVKETVPAPDKEFKAYVAKDPKIHTVMPSRDNPSYKESEFPVITLCGSTKFKDDFLKVQKELTIQGNIVISVGLFGHADKIYETEITPQIKEMLDKMHRRKIDMADFIVVINRDDYIGESTRGEIEYAMKTGKPIQYWFPHVEK